MTKDETLRLALEALEKLFGIPDMWTGENGGDVAVWRLGGSYRTQQAIHAIKEALAQPEPEPVAFKIYKPTPPRGAIPNVRDAELPWVYDQDPSSGNVASMWVTPVKATPSQHEWVGLTDEDELDWEEGGNLKDLVKAIEAKLKEKNT